MSLHAPILPNEKLAYSIEEACAATSLGTTKLYALIGEGKIAARALGRRTVILRADLQRYLESLPAWESQLRQTPRRNSGTRRP